MKMTRKYTPRARGGKYKSFRQSDNKDDVVTHENFLQHI